MDFAPKFRLEASLHQYVAIVQRRRRKAQIVADLPENKRPTVYVQRSEGPAFAAQLAAARASDPLSACGLPQVSVVVERPGQ